MDCSHIHGKAVHEAHYYMKSDARVLLDIVFFREGKAAQLRVD